MPVGQQHSAPSEIFSIRSIELFERPVELRLPFKFGITTLKQTSQAFARVVIETPRGAHAVGAAAELMVPKWFDKDPSLSHAQDTSNLRTVLRVAREAYLSDGKSTSAFGHFARHHNLHLKLCEKHGYNPLLSAFGPALIDKAILDALCRIKHVSFYDAVKSNLVGIDNSLEEFATIGADFDWSQMLRKLKPANSLFARHTVGMVDALTKAQSPMLNDGLPDTLEAAIEHYGLRYFKLKLSGQVEQDIERLEAIAVMLDTKAPGYIATLDGNEQFSSSESLMALVDAIKSTTRLNNLWNAVNLIEQPIARSLAFDKKLDCKKIGKPVIADESDGLLNSFIYAKAAGYEGISSKACKGLYKSVLNKARCVLWGDPYFLSAEDLTTQAGLGVQQDMALSNLLGITHIERNGHHYVDGFGIASHKEQEAFYKAHATLYHHHKSRTRLHIKNGLIDISSLDCVGFASGALPEFSHLSTLQAS